MSNQNPKNSQPKETFQINTNTNSHQDDQEVQKDEVMTQAPSNIPTQPNESSNETINNAIVPAHEEIQSNPYMSIIANFALSIIQNYLVKEANKKMIKDSVNLVYLAEIYQNMILEEDKCFQRIKSNYMGFQRSINELMRAILVDWIILVHHRCNMKKKTLYQCVFIIDAYLSKNIIERINLQLLGLTAFLIACKQNEYIYPSLQNCVDFTANAYTVEELIDMEQLVLQKLDYDILTPTASEFFEINADYFEFTEKQRFFGEYFLDASLIDYYLLKHKPSIIAEACCYIVAKFFKLNKSDFIKDNGSLEIEQDEVKDCANHLCNLMKILSNYGLVATKDKYMSENYMKVAELLEEN